MVKTFKQFREQSIPTIESISISTEHSANFLLEERKWISGQFPRNIGLDQPTHGVGQPHAHVFGRHGGKEVMIVNMDGTGSHGMKGKLSDRNADALRARGYKINANNIVEWIEIPEELAQLMG